MNGITPLSSTPDTVTLRRDDWESILKRLDDAADIEAVRHYESTPMEARVAYTAAEVDRMLDDGVRPVTIWRERRGLTLGALAEAAGVSKSYLSEIESGKKPGSANAWHGLARALNVRIETLIEV